METSRFASEAIVSAFESCKNPASRARVVEMRTRVGD